MPSLSDIRAHMQSIQQTRKITNAMHLISSSRMHKAMRNIEQNRAYFHQAITTMREIRSHTNIRHPYLIHRTRREGQSNTAYIVIASEKGLSGSYNYDILKLADQSMDKHGATHIFTVGDMATSHFRRSDRIIHENFAHIGQAPTINTARRLTHIIMDLYDRHEIDELRIVYTRFESAVKQTPTDIEILPIELEELGVNGTAVESDKDEVLYDPSAQEVFHELVPQFIIGYIYGALVNAYASENVARMTAMENATKSADEMLEKMNHQYHMARQISITNELSEILGAADAFDDF